MNFSLTLVGFKYLEAGKCLCGRLLAKMATIVPVPVSVPLCPVALKFFLREVEPISPSFEFGLT